MSRSSKLQVIGAKLETAQNTDAVLDHEFDYFLAEAGEVKPVPEFLPREYKHSSLSSIASVMGKLYVEVPIKVALKGTANLTTGDGYPPHVALLEACGLRGTVRAGELEEFAFGSSAITDFAGFGKSATIEVYEAGPAPIKHLIKGAVAKSAKLSVKAGGFLILDAVYQGLYTAPEDNSFPASIDYIETIKPPIMQNASFLTHGYAGVISSIEIDLGLETVLREDANSAYGVWGFAILGRKVTGTIDPEVVSVSDHDFWGKSLSRVEAEIYVGIGTGANAFSLTMSKTQYNDINYGERGALKTFKVPFQANQTSGNDELIINKYTE